MNDREMIDCDEAIRLLATFLDDELDAERAEGMERHLERCKSCFSRAEFERRLKERISEDLGVGTVPPEFETRMRMILRNLSEAP